MLIYEIKDMVVKVLFMDASFHILSCALLQEQKAYDSEAVMMIEQKGYYIKFQPLTLKSIDFVVNN